MEAATACLEFEKEEEAENSIISVDVVEMLLANAQIAIKARPVTMDSFSKWGKPSGVWFSTRGD